MREKARRIVLMILCTTGSVAAYPQYSFPQNLSYSQVFWEQLYDVSKGQDAKDIVSDWNDLSQTTLSPEQAHSLDKVMSIWKNHIPFLPKTEQLFAQKYAHLAIYLSAASPLASSSFDRTGPWMLTFPDARRYGLVVNEYVDERRDLTKSTMAARLLFEDLKEIHGANTELAFVFGPAGRLRTPQANLILAEEQLTALRVLTKNSTLATCKPLMADGITQTFPEEIDLTVLLSTIGWTESKFRSMNPHLVGNKVPANQAVVLTSVLDGHQLAADSRLLALQQKRAQDSLMLRIKSDIPNPETHQVISYRVKSGDVLGRIADRYNVGLSQIKKWNNLRSDRIDINQKLTIYYPKGKSIPTTATVTQPVAPKQEEKVTAAVDEKGKFTIYEVQAGDTLWAISKRFEGVKPEQIMAWNGIGENLSIGQKLKIKIGQ